MARLLNWSKTKGPYPGGPTWEKIAKDMGPRMFPFEQMRLVAVPGAVQSRLPVLLQEMRRRATG